MILRAMDLALMMRIYLALSRWVMGFPPDAPETRRLARLVIRTENRVTNSLIAADTKVAALASTLAGGGYHWSLLIEAKRAQDKGRPLGIE